ncbi:hypothetical protein OGATHE_000446 [Ogataea polymorpha]|uniref:Uncharacterized protein n=1 Tax=Ogataea polymorpha TaxID=460523 RepID=A0A9P8PT10_9ASCO|nr:hypothetical protein OGATHE_000446 [Ogataea polymorpha]
MYPILTELQNVSLVFLDIDVVVLPDENRWEGENENTGGCDCTVSLALSPGVINGVSDCGSNRIGHLGRDTAHVINHKDKTVVVKVPAVEAEVAERSERTGAQNGSVSEQLVSDKVRSGKPFFPDSKHREHKRTGEGGADERSGSKSESESSVSEATRVGKEHIHDQVDGVITDPEQNITGSVGMCVVARSKNNQAQQVDTHKHKKALRTAPDVQSLTDRQLQHSSHNGCQNSGRTDFRSFGEIGIRVRHHGCSDGLLQRNHEKAHPDPCIGGVHGPVWPHHGGSLYGLQTLWGVGADNARPVDHLVCFFILFGLRKKGFGLLVGAQDGFRKRLLRLSVSQFLKHTHRCEIDW